MTSEEAICILEQRSNLCRKFQYIKEAESVEISKEELNCPALFADQYRKEADAFDLAIRALQHKPSCGPLTLEQLLGLGKLAENGEKIIVYCTPLDDWCKVFKYGIMFFGTEDYRSWKEIEETYGKDWIAYDYIPAHIDIETWEPCEDCKPRCAICANYGGWDRYGKPKVCEDCKGHSNFVADDDFCSYCGRPLTEKAWNELEKRLRGQKWDM